MKRIERKNWLPHLYARVSELSDILTIPPANFATLTKVEINKIRSTQGVPYLWGNYFLIISFSLFMSLSVSLADEPMDRCRPIVNGRQTNPEIRRVTGSTLLPITPQNFDTYRRSVTTVGSTHRGAEATEVELGKRYEVSARLPRFMLLRTSTNGIHEMRGFGAESRYFRRRVVDGRIEWIGVEAPASVVWDQSLPLQSGPIRLGRVNYSTMDRAELERRVAANAGEASRTVKNTLSSPNPERARAAAQGLIDAAKYILKMIDKNEPFTLQKLEGLHAAVANGTIQTPNGDLGLGLLRGSGVRCVRSGGGFLAADMSQTSVRMGEQNVMSYTAPQDVRTVLQELLNRINAVNPQTPPSEVADIFTQFIAIHPFIDGNGRTSRMLLQYMQIKMGAPIGPIDENAAFRAFYLRPEELAHLVFPRPAAPARNGPPSAPIGTR